MADDLHLAGYREPLGLFVRKAARIAASPGLRTHELARRGLRRTFQQNAFFGELTLLENAMAAMLREHSTSLPRSIVLPWREMATRRRAEAAAAELLSSFGIGPGDHGKRPGDIAYGTQRF